MADGILMQAGTQRVLTRLLSTHPLFSFVRYAHLLLLVSPT